VTPHHLALTTDCLREYDPVFKVSPPLREREDVEACRQGLKEGVIDAIATDHAPHLDDEKELEFTYAPSGVIGLETAVGVISTVLVRSGLFSWAEIIPALTSRPSDILKLGRGRLAAGLPGDLTLIDPLRAWTVDPARFHSRSRNCPFRGWKLEGGTVLTIVGGEALFDPDGRAGGKPPPRR
jgi:dihydroorotase